jgi:hypothetical protein
MKSTAKAPPRRPRDPAYRQVFERLDAGLEKNAQAANGERMHALRLAVFGPKNLEPDPPPREKQGHGPQWKNRPAAA